MQLVFVPGYLNDEPASAVGRTVAVAARQLGYGFGTFRWRGGSAVGLAMSLAKDLPRALLEPNPMRAMVRTAVSVPQRARSDWRQKRRAAFDAGLLLSRVLEGLHEKTWLVSFSNGGFITNTALSCLRGRERPANLHGVIQIAPAADSGYRYPESLGALPFTCIHSREDGVLDVLYRLVETGSQPAGYHGYRDPRVHSIESDHGHLSAGGHGMLQTLKSIMGPETDKPIS